MITRQEAYKLYKEFANVFDERVNELRFICSKRELSFHKEFTLFGSNTLEPMSLKYKEWENDFKSRLVKLVEDKGYWLNIEGDVYCKCHIILPAQKDGETFDDVMNEVAKSALGLEPYGVSLENGLTDEVFDYMFDEAGEWIVEHKLPHAIESLNFMIERSRLEEVYDDLTKEILCSMTDCANYMRGIYEECYNEALSMLSVAKEKHHGNNDVLDKLDEQLKHGNFDDWYKYHVENQVRMNDIVGVLGQLGHLVHELNK